MLKIKLAVILMVFLLLTGFRWLDSKEEKGTGIGGILGGVIGNKLGKDKNKELWTIVGVAAGAFIGNRIGKNLDQKDKEKLAEATIKAAETGENQEWENTESGKVGQAKIVQASVDTDTDKNSNCREIEQSVALDDGSVVTEKVKACKGEDGSWAII